MNQQASPPNPPMKDTERLVLFEWHAANYESLDRCMPATPTSATLGTHENAITETDWHAITVRFAVLRKFFIEKDSKIRMDRVYRSLQDLAPEGSRMKENLLWLLEDDQWKKALQPFGRVQYAGHPTNWSVDAWLQMFLYGTAIHADPKRAKDLEPRSLLPYELWTHWTAGGDLSAHNQVLMTLRSIRAARDDGSIQLPAPWHEIWKAPPGTGPALILAQ